MPAPTPVATGIHGTQPSAIALTVMGFGVDTSRSSLRFVFSYSVDLATLRPGTTWAAYEDDDTTPGGTMHALDGSFDFDYTRCNGTFTPANGFTNGHEVRFLLTTGVVAANGSSLDWSQRSAPLSLAGAFPDEVFEGRYMPGGTTGSGPAHPAPPVTPPPAFTPPPLTQPPPPLTPPLTQPPAPGSPAPGSAAGVFPIANGPSFGGDPTTFTIEPGTTPFLLDFEVRGGDFRNDMDRVGLLSGDPATDQLAKNWIVSGTLAMASTRYHRAADGTRIPGAWKVSFTAVPPPGTPGVDYNREAIGGEGPDQGIIGMSMENYGNQQILDNGQPGLGIFTAEIDGDDSQLSPPLSSADRRFLDGSYSLGAGSAADDARMQRIHEVIANWSRAIGHTTSHECGHAVGLDHVNGSLSIMTPAASPDLASNQAQYFYPDNATVLDQNLGTE